MSDLAILFEGKLIPAVSEVLAAVISEYPQIKDVEEWNELTDRTVPVLILGPLPEVLPITYVKSLSQKQILANPAALTEIRAAMDNLLAPIQWEDVPRQVVNFLTPGQEGGLGPVLEVDIETGGDVDSLLPEETWMLSLAIYDGKNCYIFTEESLRRPSVIEQILRIFKSRKLMAHNMKFDFRTIAAQTGSPIYGHLDTMLLHHAINPGAKEHGLKPTCRKYLGAPDWDAAIKEYVSGSYKDLTEDGKSSLLPADYTYPASVIEAYGTELKVGFEAIPRHLLYDYNGWDVIWGWRLYEYLVKAAARDKRIAELAKREFAMGNFYQDVESNGFAVDVPYLHQLKVEYTAKKDPLLEKLQDMAGPDFNKKEGAKKWAPFNPGSHVQVKRWFAERGIILKSTDEKHLDDLQARDNLNPRVQEFIDTLLEYRGVGKVISTNIDGILKRIHYGNLVFPDFLVHGTNTGRTSSRDPNIQNVPREKSLRKIFISRNPEKNVILNVDYSQAELRVMACLSEDEYLISLFQEGMGDFFDSLMPSAFPNADISAWTPQEAKDNRAKLKATIYGLAYNRKAAAIAKDLGMSVREAQNIINNFFRSSPQFYDWRQWVEGTAVDPESTLVSPFGRYYQAEVVTGRNKQNVINAGLAFLPQSTASDLCVDAAMRVHEWLPEYPGTWLTATVHDAIMFDVPRKYVEEVAARVQWEMRESGRRIFGDTVPFATDAQWGDSWGDCG